MCFISGQVSVLKTLTLRAGPAIAPSEFSSVLRGGGDMELIFYRIRHESDISTASEAHYISMSLLSTEYGVLPGLVCNCPMPLAQGQIQCRPLIGLFFRTHPKTVSASPPKRLTR